MSGEFHNVHWSVDSLDKCLDSSSDSTEHNFSQDPVFGAVLALRDEVRRLTSSFRESNSSLVAKETELGQMKEKLASLEATVQQLADSQSVSQSTCCQVSCTLF